MPDPGFYRRHLDEDVLAWWLAHGPDPEFGGVLTCFANSGDTLVSTDKYTWSQGRWVWLLARLFRAARSGLIDQDPTYLLDQALRTAEFVAANAVLDDATTAYVLTREGVVKPYGPDGDPHASVFADLFAALGFAGLHAALREQDVPATRAWGELGERLLVSAYQRIRAGAAKSEPYPVDPRFQAFAEPMMLMHTAAELHAATGSERSREIAVAAARHALHGGFVTGSDVHDLAPRGPDLADTLLARHRTPGHLLEFLWFFRHAARDVPELDAVLPGPEWTVDAALTALRLGWDEESGGLLRYVDMAGGQPTGVLLDDRYESLVTRTWDTKLWWPHAEALYTTALLARRDAHPELAGWYERIHDYTFATFPDGPGREWTQIRTRAGAPLDEVVALPVKDPFHIARALLLLVELLGETEN
jgi:N-acylglucosamine 2-epimerase